MRSQRPVPKPSVGYSGEQAGHQLTHARPLLLQVSTHLHPSSEDEDMEGVFPNELSLQQVRVARPSPQSSRH